MTLHAHVVRFFQAFSHFAIRRPKLTLLLAVTATLTMAPGLLRLKLRTDGHALVSSTAPEVIYDKSVRDAFGIEDQIVVVIRSAHPDGIFNVKTIGLVRDLTAKLQQMPGINSSNITSLATESSFRLRPGSLNRQTLLEPPLKTKAELDTLHDDIRRIELYTGTVVSFDGASTAIMVGVPTGADRTKLYDQVLDILTATQTDDEIGITGSPVAEALLGIHILEDLGVPESVLGTTTRSLNKKTAETIPKNFGELRTFVAAHIGLVPIAVLVMALVFFFTFRNIIATLLPMPEVCASLVFIFGLMGFSGVPIYLTIAVMPVLLTAMCVTDEIHVFSRYFAALREQPGVDHTILVRQIIDEMCCPVANTSLTTAIGFVSFAFSPLGPVQAFGIFTAIGVVFCLFWSLTVIPAMLVLIPPRWLLSKSTRGNGESAISESWFGRLALGVARYRWWLVGLTTAIAVLTPIGIQRLIIQDSWIEGFQPESDFRKATTLVNHNFHGMHLLFVTFNTQRMLHGEVSKSAFRWPELWLPGNFADHPTELAGCPLTFRPAGASTNTPGWRARIEMSERRGTNIVVRLTDADPIFAKQELPPTVGFDFLQRTHVRPDTIRLTAELASFIRERRQYAVGGVIGPADYLATTSFMVRPNDPASRAIPADAEGTKLMWDYYRIVRGPERLRQLVTTNFSRSILTVFLKDANFVDTARLMKDIRDYEREHLASRGISLGFAGDVAVSQSLIRSIVTTQIQSLLGSLAGIYLLTSLLGRSWRWGLYCVIPSTLAVAINFAVMGWLSIPLGVATSMFAGMTLGIGVDFAIHVLECYSLAQAGGQSLAAALRSAFMRTGPAVLTNTLAVSLGFGVLMLSQVPANARLGLLTVLGLVDCLIATLLLLPVLLHWWPLSEPVAKTAESILESQKATELINEPSSGKD